MCLWEKIKLCLNSPTKALKCFVNSQFIKYKIWGSGTKRYLLKKLTQPYIRTKIYYARCDFFQN